MLTLFPISQLFWFGVCLCAWLLAAAAPGSVPCKDYLPPILRIENSLNGSTSTRGSAPADGSSNPRNGSFDYDAELELLTIRPGI